MESTDRRELGANIIAPISSHAGQKLVVHVQPGDLVVHYYQLTHEIVAYSIAEADPFESLLRWPDRELSEEAPAYEEALGHFTFLDDPISLEQLRDHEQEIRLIKNELDILLDGHSVYFPFQIPASRPIAPAQGAYLTKLPKAVFDPFPTLQEALEVQSNLPPVIKEVPQPGRAPRRPRGPSRSSTGGRQTDVKKKLAAEEHAMTLAKQHLEALGYEVENVSDQPSLGYDLRGTKGAEVVGCEAKGSLNSRIGVDLHQKLILPGRSRRHFDHFSLLQTKSS